jgi:uncharacterized repeat protein (TIGR02543 family)
MKQMRKMKLDSKIARLPLLIAHCSLLFVLCSLLLSCPGSFVPSEPENIPLGKGAFFLSVTVGDPGRTILPPETPVKESLWYTLVFTRGGTALPGMDRSYAELPSAIYLDEGTYSLVVKAYKDVGRNSLVAQGSSTSNIVISGGSSASSSILLKAVIEDGTQGSFRYTVEFPSGLTTARMELIPLRATGSTPDPVALSSGATGTLPNLNTGYYNVVFTLEKTNGDRMLWSEILHVYANLESTYTKTFNDEDFYRTSYTATYVYNDDVTDKATLSVVHGKTAEAQTVPDRSGHVFDGWCSDIDLTLKYNFSTPVINDITLYAKWVVPVTSVSLSSETLVLGIDGTETLIATIQPASATTKTVTWSSNNPLVASVDEDGLVTALARGTATITVTTDDGNKTASCTVNVFIGSGEEASPYEIWNEADLRRVGTGTAGWDLNKHYTLMENINLAGKPNWMPIGTYSTPFTGTFDGAGLSISGITISNATADYQGMFGYISGNTAVVEKLALVNVNITSSSYLVGGIAGSVYNNAKVINCSVSGSIVGDASIGGVVGGNDDAEVENCYFTGNVSSIEDAIGGDAIGGVVGSSIGIVQNCYATGNVSGGQSIGGVVGRNFGTVQNCYATGDVSGTYTYIGGVVGYNENGGTVQNCYATGNVSGNNNIGGVVGINNGGGRVQNSVALNANIGTTGTIFGRIIGSANASSTMSNNHARNDMQEGGEYHAWTQGLAAKDGADIAAADYGDQAWWSSTAFINPVFGTAWEWHSTNNLPILKGFAAGSQNPKVNSFNTLSITITTEQILDEELDIDAETISRNGTIRKIEFELEGSYTSYEWSMDHIGTLSTTSSCTVDATDTRYNSSGKHALHLVVVKSGIPYSKTIWVTITENDNEK